MKEHFFNSQIFTSLLTLFILSLGYIVLHFLKKKFCFPAEISRKIVHISLGLTTLSFPFIFRDTWIVWTMCGVSITALLILKYSKLKQSLGASLHSVERHSFGDILFPFSVAVLFQLAHTTPVFYIIPVLVLTLADALAAIIGVYYGKAHYDASEGIKSWEGSLFFFITAFLCIQIPLLLMSDYSNANIIIVSAFIALLITLCEAVSWQGLDNLFIPLGVYITLTNYLNYTLPILFLLCIILTALLIVGIYLRKKSTMNFSALLFSIVLGFLYVTLDPFSFVIPLAMFLLYSYIVRKDQCKLQNSHTVLTILYLNLGGLFWAFMKANGHNNLALDFSVYYCIQIGIISWIHQYYFYKKFSFITPFINAAILFTLVFFIYAYNTDIFSYRSYCKYFLYMVISLVISLAIFVSWSRNKPALNLGRERLIVQGGSAFIGSIIFYVIRSIYA